MINWRDMRLRQHMEDFVVEEVPRDPPGGRGDFLIARLDKRGLGTLEAVRELARKLGVSLKRISFGGLKDARSVSRQYLSIAPGNPPAAGLPRHLKTALWEFEAVGRGERAYDRSSYAGNRFELTLRDLSDEDCALIALRAPLVARDGFANYYDTQRFGSLEGTDKFVARLLIDEDYEGALRAAIASPRPDSNAEGDKIKAIMREFWGRWPECKAALPPCRERSIVTYLCDHSLGFVHAFELLDRPLRLLYTGAYQGFLWNRVLSKVIRWTVADARVKEFHNVPGASLLIMELSDAERISCESKIIPQATPKLFDEQMNYEIQNAYNEVLKEEGLTPRSFKLKKVRSTYFQKGRRQAVAQARNLAVGAAAADELNAGRKKIRVQCELPRGSYVTMLVRALLPE